MKSTKQFLFTIILIFVSKLIMATDSYPKNVGIDITHYTFALFLSDEVSVIKGTASISYRLLQPDIKRLRFDLINKSDAAPYRGMRVVAVTRKEVAVNFTHENDVLWIDLDTRYSINELNEIEISYEGEPATGLRIGSNKYGDRTFFSDNWPNKARHWLPTVDHPYDKATCEFIVTAPLHYQVISNGLKVEETNLDGEQKLTHWKQSVPIASWLFALGVAEFAVQYMDKFEGKSIQTWVYRQDRDSGFYDFAVPSKDALQFFSDYVGPYAYEKLANVQTNSVSGGMEAASSIFYDSRSVTGHRTERWQQVIVHEIAHQWFGNAVTEYDWDDVWLSEGFATYFTMLFLEHAQGKKKFVDELEKSRNRIFAFYKDNKDYRIVHNNLTDMSKVTTIQTYQKGAWTLHMLRQLIGDDHFQKGIKSYYENHYNGNATTADFIKEMEKESGQDLSIFFKQWLYQGGNLELNVQWKFDPKTSRLQVRLDQLQSKYLFQVPVEIGLRTTDSGALKIERLTLNEATQIFEFPMNKEPQELVVDPNTKLLSSWKIQKN